MNVNRILLCIIMASLSIHAMEVPVGNAPLPPCPGGELASQPDLRHQVTVNNKKYYLINRDGQGLTDHDRTRLQQIVPFALDETNHDYTVGKYVLGGLIIGGLGLYVPILADLIVGRKMRLSELSFAKKLVMGLLLPLMGGLSGLRLAPDRKLNPAESQLQSTIKNELYHGENYNPYKARRKHRLVRMLGPLTIHSECYLHEQTIEQQQEHEKRETHARMAFGAVYVPRAIRNQLERQNDAYKPLETYLRQSDSPINEILNIPQSYRGNWIFVNAMMKLIHECEICDRE